MGLEFVADRESRRPFPKELNFASRIAAAVRRRGVIVTPGLPLINHGKNGDHIQISPPFTIEIADIDIIVNALDDALTEIERAIGSEIAASSLSKNLAANGRRKHHLS